MFKRLFPALPLSLILLALLPSASAKHAFAGPWPLLPDGVSAQAGEIWGELPSGLRYVIVPTDSASEVVSLRLLVAAGRAQDAKGKAGTSELLADLAAYGSKNVTREQLVEFKLANGIDPQSRGYSQVDVNHTVYRLDLEEPTPSAVEVSVGLLAEIAGAPLLDAAALEAAKKRVAYAAGLGVSAYEPAEALLERVLLKSSSYSKMGDADVAASAPSITLDDVEQYWSQWYKADRMVVVVTGVVDSAVVEALLKKKFAPITASPELAPVSEKGDKFRSGGDLETADAPSSMAGLWITKIVKAGSLFDAAAEQNYYTLDFIGRVAQSYATGSDRLPHSALTVYGDSLALSINRRGSVVSLLEQLVAADKAVHRISEYGIRSEDLERAKKDYLDLRNSYDMQVSSREWAPMIADRAVRCVVDQIPFRYGAKLSEYISRVVSQLTFDGVRDRSKALFRLKDLSYYLELPKAFPLGSKAVSKRLKGMRKGYDFTWEQAGQADQDWNMGTGFQTGGMVDSTEIIRFEEYPVLKYQFANKLRMNLIRTDAFPGRVQVNISFGNGSSGLEDANPAFESMVRTLMLKTKIGGGAQSPTLREMLEAKGIENLEGGVTKDHLYWSGVGRDASDIEEFLSGIVIWMVAGNLDEKMYDDEFENLEKVVERSMDNNSSVRLDEMLYESDARLRSYFKKEDVEALEFTAVRDWLFSVRESSYIEITVVGDVVPRTVLRDVRKTFGSSPDRTGKVLQPRHGKPVKWNESGIVKDTFKMAGDAGNITLLFPQVTEKSCSNDRLGSVFVPLIQEHLVQALADHPKLVGNLSVELVGHQMVPLSNAIKVRVYSSEEDAAEAESLILSAAASFGSSLTAEKLIAAERNALIGLKRIARSQSSLIDLFSQSQGKPKTLGCVQELLSKGFGTSFEEYQDVATRQFSEDNVRGVVLMPKAK